MTTLVTTTHNRPEAFALLEKWVAAQTEQPATWLVINDSKPEIAERYRYTMGQRVFAPVHTGTLHSLCANWDFAVKHIKTEKCIVAEDDDYISPYFVEVLSGLLDRAPLVGLSEDLYYNIAYQEFRCLGNVSYASLATTGFCQGVIPLLRTIARRGDPYIDGQLWDEWKGEKLLTKNMHNGKPLHVGIKGMYQAGMPGSGISGMSHYEHSGTFDWGHNKLREWIGTHAITILEIRDTPK